MNKGAGDVLLYDSLDKPNADQKKKQEIKTDWRIQGSWYVFLVFVIVVVFILYLLSMQWINSYDERVVLIGMVVLYTGTISVAILSISSVILFIYSEYIRIQREKLVNVMEYQTTLNQLNGILTPYFDVAKTRAQHSIFAGIQNLTYNPVSNKTNTNEQVEAINPDVPLLESELPILEDMQKQGIIGRSGNSILLGWSGE